ncbi:hypothetical protein GIB67_013165 [Kingdonia uniflora]|uniref:Methylenetetrahydrofolate reductase n=1 Tax=Kingdonia uniflora TaxID=39325 RepID=A0A7J7LCJ9_9MAGN|nr:hypothetical protein GIB67_013165 [Kingdonia uniflora]
MPVEKIDHALDSIKSYGIHNVLALRGEPPHGYDKFVKTEVRLRSRSGKAYEGKVCAHNSCYESMLT